jgi:predicted nucleotidyltransferase
MKNNFGLPDDVYGLIVDALRRYPEINDVKIFGSRAMGNHKRYSDIDIAIYADTDADLSQNIKEELEDLDVIYFFDVLHYEKIASAEVKAHIDRVGISI